jgi:hypothetical protein
VLTEKSVLVSTVDVLVRLGSTDRWLCVLLSRVWTAWRTALGTAQNDQSVLEQEILRDDRSHATGLQKKSAPLPFGQNLSPIFPEYRDVIRVVTASSATGLPTGL